MPVTKTILAQTKNIDYRPGFASESYWKSHAIALVKITKVTPKTAKVPTVTWKVLTAFSEPGRKTATVPVRNLWLWAKDGRQTPPLPRPELKVGTCLLAFESREKPEPIAVMPVADSETEPLINTLEEIAAIHKHLSPENLTVGALSDDALVAEYGLRILREAGGKPSADFLAKLKTQAEEAKKSAVVRILSYELTEKSMQGGGGVGVEHAWLRDAVTRSLKPEWWEIRPFVSRMVDLKGCRSETVAFLTGLILNRQAHLPSKVAAHSILHDRRLFNYANPDEDTEKIFSMCLEMLKDLTPQIRSAGASMLHTLPSPMPSFKRGPFVRRAVEGMQKALAVESFPATQFHLKTFLKSMERYGVGN